MTIEEGFPKTKEGLPREAFAIVGDPDDPETWKLPHHTKAIFRALKGKLDIEKTVDWDRMPAAVAALSPGGYRGERVQASPEDILKAAKHLAAHYRKADKPIPDTLASLGLGRHVLFCHCQGRQSRLWRLVPNVSEGTRRSNIWNAHHRDCHAFPLRCAQGFGSQ